MLPIAYVQQPDMPHDSLIEWQKLQTLQDSHLMYPFLDHNAFLDMNIEICQRKTQVSFVNSYISAQRFLTHFARLLAGHSGG